MTDAAVNTLYAALGVFGLVGVCWAIAWYLIRRENLHAEIRHLNFQVTKWQTIALANQPIPARDMAELVTKTVCQCCLEDDPDWDTPEDAEALLRWSQ